MIIFSYIKEIFTKPRYAITLLDSLIMILFLTISFFIVLGIIYLISVVISAIKKRIQKKKNDDNEY